MKRAEKVATASRELLEPLRRAPIAISCTGEGDPLRAKHLPHIEAMLRGVPSRRAAASQRRERRGYAIAAAALLMIGAAATLRYAAEPTAKPFTEHGATVVAGSVRVGNAPPLIEGNRFVGEAAIETPRDASARLVTESGVEVALSSASRARLHPARQRQRVDLMQGEVTLNVPQLTTGSTVSVVTPDATVTVHGTRFSVAYDTDRARPSTCVRVTEGVVAVDRGMGRVESLRAGQSSGCEPIPRPSEPQRGPVTDPQDSPPRQATSATTSAARTGAPPSTLAVENQLLLAGLAAERRHDRATARAELNELLARFPNSPLAAEARDALSRLESQRE